MSRVRGRETGSIREVSPAPGRGRELGAGDTELSLNGMPPSAETIFYDGECGLCHRAVRFVLRYDREERFRFAPLSGETFVDQVPEAVRTRLPDTLVVAPGDDRYLVRSDAVLHVLDRLGGAWKWSGRVASWMPRAFRDWIYDAVASRRARLFSRPGQNCPTESVKLLCRFDP